MIGALWTGISGLSSHQTALDNESHNISNVNTVGYKSSRISFADQMYQDRIGKGSKVLDAEKLYVQGNLKLTGVDYDMALSGDGFFTVKNTTASGTGENYYTRAGNFRMGDNGTLQDAAGNEVQGWAMRPIDTDKDVVSTNPNNKTFTSDYTKLLSSKVIKHSNYVETITAKATDYSQTAKADSDSVFEGAGGKSRAAKISDVETLVANYASWLQKLQDEPDGGSASSTSQISQINFKSGADGLITKEGDQIYAYVDGNKISQNYVSTSASNNFIESFLDTGTDLGHLSFAGTTFTVGAAENLARYEMTIDGETVFYDSDSNATIKEITEGLQDAITSNATLSGSYTLTVDSSTGTIDLGAAPVSASTNTFKSDLDIDYDIAASRIATYRALADQISEIPGLRAYMVSEDGGTNNDVLEDNDIFDLSTSNSDMLKGILQIESLVPGEAFEISEVGEISGSNSVAGAYQTTTLALTGEGVGALQSARDALARAITGKQQDVYTPADLGLSSTSTLNDFTYSLSIFDKELEKIIPVPNDNATIPQPVDINISDVSSVQDFVDQFNAQASSSSPALSDYVEALNINGNVVIQTKDDNYDVEFSGSLKDAVNPVNVNATTTATTATISGANIDFGKGIDFTYNYDDGVISGSIDISDANSLADIATQISSIADLTATVNAAGDIVVTSASGGADFTVPAAANNSLTNNLAAPVSVPLDKNNDYSGRQGAGAEFIELVNTVDQTTTQSSLQLKLDTLGISDSAFGEFSVDSSGLITMKQDGAEFAIGQVSIALFNNTRGLNPSGDNLLAKTNESGEPIYNLNNDKTAKIEGKTLELSTADLSESLVNLMVFQRAFEANAKSITTSDQLLNTLINLKR
ncbi:flagellar biosynthesis protein FlgE [Arcobacter sp. F155]|uniref:flagellar hook-basal body complex protein n=1 Tax=Arcobacter sp. F155 TaxID=2044512 RepID=UPI00100A8223|nr:flagellar hook-basal body complex protein [Arcobacter sp. F155]RXJ76522.1 flagellar biosynthesis protein FlgE [Arcobacter sp. F155]